MTDTANKTIVTRIMDALAEGNTRPFGEAMADDFTWHIEGTNAWSGTYSGKSDVQTRLMKVLFRQFATQYRCRATRILADGDFVVVQCRGEVTTKAGKPYNNSYCYVIEMADGRMKALTEYMDTALVASALEPPGAAAA